MSYNIGPKIGIDGEAEFRKQIHQINQEYKTLQAETKAVTAAFEANGDEQGKLEATGKQLQKQIENQKEKITLLEDAVKKASDKFGENSIEANRLRGALFDAQATVTGLEGDLKDVQSKLDRAGDAMEDFGENADEAGKSALDFGDILGANLVSNLAMDALRNAAGLIKDFAVGSIEIAASVKAANSQFEQSFGKLEDEAKAALENISDDTNIATTRMQESYTRIFAFAQTVGTESDEALDIASRAMVAAADSAAYYDRSIEEVTETLQSFLKGNYANDAALGISATEVSRNTKANELYAKSFKELSEAQKVDVLLAMVEAGNAASGAIGQAARESDSWENVTGEMAEAMRQLQAEAGKAALKKLTPIIQKITDATYELIEDVDWDEFGDKVADTIDFVVDNGPKIVKTVTSVGTGIVAFKATKKAGEFVTLASSFLKVGAAAKTAGTAVAASGAVASASPWGLAALAISGVVAVVTSLAFSANESEIEVNDLKKSMDDFVETMEDAENTCKSTTTEVEGTAHAAEIYVRKLEELEAAGLDSTATQKEYAAIVDQLNQLVPELNLSIDEQTGLVNQNTDAIRADIDAWKEQAVYAALREKYTEQLKAQGEAAAELTIAEVQLGEMREDREIVERRLASLSEALTETTNDLTTAREALAKSTDPEEVERLSQEVRNLELRQDDYYDGCMRLQAELEELRGEEENFSDQIEDSKDLVASYADDFRLLEAAMQQYTEEIANSTDEQEKAAIATKAVQEKVDELAVAYQEAKTAARDSIDSQIGIFDELAAESEWSTSKIIENWDKQKKAFSDYEDNIDKALKMGLDEELVKTLSDGSEDSMQILDAMVNGSENSVSEINDAFTQMDLARDSLSETMAEIDMDLDDAMQELKESAKDGGINIVDGLIEGVDLRIPEFKSAMRRLSVAGQETMAETDDSHSPSRKYEEASINNVDGLIVGADKMISKFEGKMKEVATAGQMAYLNSRLSRAENYPDTYGQMLTSTVQNNNRTVNMGGINVQIYPQAGQDTNEIADAVMDRIQTEIERKGAGL